MLVCFVCGRRPSGGARKLADNHGWVTNWRCTCTRLTCSRVEETVGIYRWIWMFSAGGEVRRRPNYRPADNGSRIRVVTYEDGTMETQVWRWPEKSSALRGDDGSERCSWDPSSRFPRTVSWCVDRRIPGGSLATMLNTETVASVFRT